MITIFSRSKYLSNLGDFFTYTSPSQNALHGVIDHDVIDQKSENRQGKIGKIGKNFQQKNFDYFDHHSVHTI